MGVELYPFIEVDWSRRAHPFPPDATVRAFNLGEFFVWRDPQLFRLLGWRSCPRCLASGDEPSTGLPEPLFPLRGLPPGFGSGVLGRFFHLVDNRPSTEIHHPTLPTVRAEAADSWLAQGLSIEGPPHGVSRGSGHETLRRVSCPTWHCVSWLTLDEYQHILDRRAALPSPLRPDAPAIAVAMRALEADRGPGRTRLVTWFDNP